MANAGTLHIGPRDHYKVRIYDGVAFHILCDHRE